MRKCRRARRRHDPAQRRHDQDEIHLGGLLLLRLQRLSDFVDHDGREVVETFTDRVEHDLMCRLVN